MDIAYRRGKCTEGDRLFREIIDYSLDVPCTNRPDRLEYIYRLYRYGEHLYITDIFPRMFADDSKCFQRFTSHEGYTVSMRQLAVTCLEIFVSDFIGCNPDSVMVVSGSYEPGEATDGPSRKLRLYRYFFTPLLDRLNLDLVDMAAHNAFLLLNKASPTDRESLRKSYLQFKAAQHQNNG